MARRRRWRILFAVLLVACAGVVVANAVGAATGSTTPANRTVEPRDGITVVATDSNSWLGTASGGPRSRAELVAYASNGSALYYNDSHTRYWDVDPVPGTRTTVQYVAADHLASPACAGSAPCTRNVVERVNLTTGNVTRVYSRITPGKHATRWHDVDRLNSTHLVVADIAQDRVYVVDTTSGLIEWEWDAQNAFDPLESGGPYPSDWTHINDVEALDDGRIMVSVRNHDQVVFLDRQRGVVENWTLGTDGAHDVLYEQHNPDYIPAENGGPSVLVADSENDRVVEYHRSNGRWQRAWTWQDARLQWPRDADRLPNGNTLVTDSNGDRVFEVAPNGTVVWSVEIGFPYEAERLGTGAESTGGPSAGRADLQGRTASGSGGTDDENADTSRPVAAVTAAVADALDGPLVNSVAYVLPVWMGTVELVAAALVVLVALCWLVVEWRWSSWSLAVRWPIRLRR